MSEYPARERAVMRATEGPNICRDQIRADASQALRWSTRSQRKHLATALNAHPSRVSRECNGQDGRVSRFYEAVRGLVREGRTDAGHVIAGAMVVAEDEALKLPGDEIRRRLREALAQECLTEGSENVASLTLANALGGEGDLRAALEGFVTASRREMGPTLDAIVYARALLRVRGWR